MKKITVYIDGASKTIDLQESILTTPYSHIMVKKAYVFWEYCNIPNIGYHYTQDGTKTVIPVGYHTFNDLKGLLESNSVQLEAIKTNGKCRIIISNTPTDLTLSSKLAALLGFTTRVFTDNDNVTSEGKVSINQLQYLKVSCNIVDTSCNTNEEGRKDSTIISLPVMTTQPLFGSVSDYVDIESKVRIDKGVINQLMFRVTDQNGIEIDAGKILLECYLL